MFHPSPIQDCEFLSSETPPRASVVPVITTQGISILRQIQLIPSGVQPWFSNVLSASSSKIAYCSTTAVYVYSLTEGFSLVCMLAGHSSSLTCCTFSPHNENMLATSSIDGR